MINGTLNIDLKETKVVEEPKGWFMKLLTGKTEYEKEAVTQIQYLEKVYKIFSELGWKNIVSLDLNKETVYEDSEYKDNDFEEAINLAYGKIEEKDFEVAIHLENTEAEKEETVTVDFSSKHDVGEFPLVVEVELAKTSEEVEAFLNDIKNKINDAFGIESGIVEVDNVEEDSNEDEDEENSEEEDSDSEDESESKESKETAEQKEEIAA